MENSDISENSEKYREQKKFFKVERQQPHSLVWIKN